MFLLRILGEHDQFLRMVVRQRPEHEGWTALKIRGVGADTQSENRNRGKGEARVLVQHPDAEGDVSPEILQPHPAALIATPFFQLIHSSETALCGMACFLRRQSRLM